MLVGQTKYQISFEKHCNAVLAIVRHLITRIADEMVEIASRVVALAAPLPNAISMYNITQNELGYHWAASMAFAVTLELAVFFSVEVALRMWDRYLEDPRRNKMPFYASLTAVAVVVIVVMVLVGKLEPHGVMVLLPIVSLCSFVGLGLKRWDERSSNTTLAELAEANRIRLVLEAKVANLTECLAKGLETPAEPTQTLSEPSANLWTPNERRSEVLRMLTKTSTKDEVSFAEWGRTFGTSDTTIRNDLKWLIQNGYWQNGDTWAALPKASTLLGTVQNTN